MRYVASREEMQDIDAYSINNVGIPGIVLMEKAALALEEVFLERIPTDSRVLIVTEKGNNGGDGLALGRLLLEEGYTVDFYEIGVIPHDSDSHQIQKHILIANGFAAVPKREVLELDMEKIAPIEASEAEGE